MSFPFKVTEHTIPAQHIREWPRATAVSQDDVLQLRVKQYTPFDNLEPRPGDVTIIAAQANGFPKEIWEPIWADLHAQSQKQEFRIRGIWTADPVHQGYSGLQNKPMLGNDPSWYDHARDLLQITNLFRADMPRPIVGMGHSFGGNVITHLALLHTRLFTALVLFDPIIMTFSTQPSQPNNALRMSALRPDQWPSREAAADSFRRSRFHASWDPRVLEAWVTHGIYDSPELAEGKAALTTSRHQEAFTSLRPLYPYIRDDGTVDRAGAPDFDPALNDQPRKGQPFQFYRDEGPAALARLPHLRPSVLWVYGGASYIPQSTRSETVKACGSGSDGSGGVEAGRVAEVVVEGRGHLFPLEVPALCAEHAARWIETEMQHYRKAELEYKEWAALPLREKATMDQQFLDALNLPPARKKKARNGKGSNL